MDTACAAEWLGVHTTASKKCLVEQRSQWKSDPHQLQHLCGKYTAMKQALQKQPALFSECEQVFQEFAHMETEVETLLSNSDMEKESYNEILFLKPMFQPLNFVPFLLMIWSVLRIYLFPGLALLVPFLTLLAPYFLLTFVLEVPITFHRYRVLLQSMLSGNTQALLDPLTLTASSGSGSGSSFVQTAKQCGMAIFTIIQGILQPYWTHQHLSSIDQMIQTKGALLIRCRERYEHLATLLEGAGCVPFRCPLPPFSSEREAVAHAILSPFYFKMMLKVVGSLEVLVRLAHHPDLHPVRWVSSATPVFRAKDTFDFRVPVEQRKTISVRMDSKRHALLTGPNKGGKSTVLRALAASALFAHTYGCAMGHVTMTPFHSMYVCLTPDDLPGSKSRFEREIEFTARTLRGDQPLLVLMDELFHSTNPPDALRSCEIYCHKLWNKPQIVSMISTHLFDFVERAAPTVQRLCCPATVEKGEVRFSYELVEGICKVSSVDSLLQQWGHFAPPYPLP